MEFIGRLVTHTIQKSNKIDIDNVYVNNDDDFSLKNCGLAYLPPTAPDGKDGTTVTQSLAYTLNINRSHQFRT